MTEETKKEGTTTQTQEQETRRKSIDEIKAEARVQYEILKNMDKANPELAQDTLKHMGLDSSLLAVLAADVLCDPMPLVNAILGGNSFEFTKKMNKFYMAGYTAKATVHESEVHEDG